MREASEKLIIQYLTTARNKSFQEVACLMKLNAMLGKMQLFLLYNHLC